MSENFTLEDFMGLYRNIKKQGIDMGMSGKFHLAMTPRVCRKLFGEVLEEIEIDGELIRIECKNITERDNGDGSLSSDLYIYDPDQMKKNQEESDIYNKGLAGLI